MLDLTPAAAEIFLTLAICVVLIVDVFLKKEQRLVTFYLAILSVIGTAVCSVYFGVDETTIALNGAFIGDQAGNVLKLFSYLVIAVVFLYSRDYLLSAELFRGEFFVLSLFGLLGVMVMISAHNLLILYLGLELLSLSLYALVAFDRDSGVAAESAMKYFVLGAIASGTLLYGISILYGVTGTIHIDELAEYFSLSGGTNVPALLGLAFVIVGVAFKFGAVPFHMWLPDVYQGAPAPVTLFVATAPKLAAFALAWRFLIEGLGGLHGSWQDMVVVLSVLSLAVGNVVAIAQTNLKRMLAYSTISHVGFILMGFIAGTEDGIRAAMFYTLTYVLMAAAAFGMIIALSRKGYEAEHLEDFKGLNARSPWFAAMMLMVMFSMAGVPPFVGFYAKLAVLSSVLDAGLVWLAVFGVIFAVIGAFYYIRIVWYMYFIEPKDTQELEVANDFQFILSANALALLLLGLFPGYLLDLCASVL
ncbi:MAG: NADH-quinone oxidoreductase subunit NuoN [Pseudomonadota bacterium]|jgi:NADH-quinone oxidoreductase subunit N|nr:NADH-quinone oxidoreductase subunit NuoN [Pseudomonadota bacterium]